MSFENFSPHSDSPLYSSVVALGVSYAIPIAINVLQMRRKLPATRGFILPEAFAWVANLVGIAYVLVTTVLFLFPPELPATGSNMNYCIVAFSVWLFISVFQWFIDGRKNYTGPKIDIDEHVLVAAPTLEESRTMEETHGVNKDHEKYV